LEIKNGYCLLPNFRVAESLFKRNDPSLLMQKNFDKLICERSNSLSYFDFQNRVGMTENLVDIEGYPRNDIDVYQVRLARHKIICTHYNRILFILFQIELMNFI
jgi:hypothetical protein